MLVDAQQLLVPGVLNGLADGSNEPGLLPQPYLVPTSAVQWQHSYKCLLIIFLYFILGEMKCTLESGIGAILSILTDSF